jgi:hypothetical protein
MSILFSRRSLGIAAIVAIPVAVFAASPVSKTVDKETGPAVGLFEGMASGDIEVTVVAKDAKEGMLTVKNKANKPLTIKLPEAFAAVPVLAQRGGARGGAGGMGGMGGGMGGMGGGGMFNIAPEKITKIKFVAVCLDHGKKDPTPNMPYQIIPIESYAKNGQVSEMIKMLVRGEIDQHSAQAAAWHLQNGLSWEELTNKIGAKHLNGSVEAYFTPANLQRALAASQVAVNRAEKLPEQAASTAAPALKPYRSPSENLATPQ